MRPRHRRPSPRKLVLEMLEDRTAPSATTAASAYGRLPLAFEVNQGQVAAPVDFLARGNGYTLSLTAQDAHLDLGAGTALDLQLVGAGHSAAALGVDPLITKTNYLVGSDPRQWHTNIPNFGRIEYHNVYPGIDLAYYGNQGQLEYDFVVAPGANPNAIKLSIQGAQSLALDSHGNLVLHEPGGDVIEQAPVVYQDIGGLRQAVAGRFVLEGNNQFGFQLGAYDPSRPLVIDPTLSYSSYIGGNSGRMFAIAVDSAGAAYLAGDSNHEAFVAKLNAAGSALIYQTFLGGTSPNSVDAQANGIAVDAAGNAYVTGMPGSNFPTTANALSQSSSNGFVAVLDPSGANLIYSTFLPGAALEPAPASSAGAVSGRLAIDSSGNVYVTGSAGAGFPTTAGAFQSALAAGATTNAFLAKINPNLSGSASLVYGSYLGGAGTDAGSGVAVDAGGNAYVTGYTSSSNFPTTPGAFQTSLRGSYNVFVAKFNPAQSGSASLVYSTYLGGSGTDGYPWILLVPVAIGIVFPTPGPAIAVDSSGDAYVAGGTSSTNFPTTAGAYEPSVGSFASGATDAFVTKLNPAGSGLVYSTYLGPYSPGPDYYTNAKDITRATSIALDSAGNAYVTGLTRSDSFPTTSNAIQGTLSGSLINIGTKNHPMWVEENVKADAFVTTLNASGSSLLFSTYLGGTDDDFAMGLALDSAGNTYVAGVTSSANFPTTAGAYDTTAPFGNDGYGGFVFKIDPPVESSGTPAPTISAPRPSSGSFVRTGLSDFALGLGPALLNAPVDGMLSPAFSSPGSIRPSALATSIALLAPLSPADVSLPRTGALPGGGEDAIDYVFSDWHVDEGSILGS
jgi:hypothetical protein